MKQLDIVAIGNAMLDVFLIIQEQNRFTKINNEEKEICFAYGEKIHVESYKLCIGGNASNVAVGLRRLGFLVGLCVEVGDDEFSQKIMHGFASEGLDASHVIQTKNSPSSFSVGINFGGERTLFVEHVKRIHKFQFENLKAQWFYLTSLGVEWKEAYKNALDFAKDNGVKLAFSPGTHQFEELTAISDVLSATDILFVNKEEATRISNFKFQISNTQEMKALLQVLQSMGPKVVSITDGKEGSYALEADGTVYKLGMFPGNALERTGAGDAYASGFLAAIIAGHDILDAMRWGAINAASVVSQVGSQAGLLKREEIEKKLTDFPEFKAKEI
ncbi:MAG: carbohydrate kinase family protein [Candidatus Levybacteria bacterium]|nr:carbohydrate kinase family protein [Candidatus Levybacteria bacterium]